MSDLTFNKIAGAGLATGLLIVGLTQLTGGVFEQHSPKTPGYAVAMAELGGKQPVWDYDHLYEFLKGPQKYLPGTKMTFVGLKKPEDRINVIAYLKSEGGTLPVPAPDPSRAPGAAAPAAGAPAAP